MIDAETVIAVCTASGLVGSAAGWFGRHFTLKSTNGHLTEVDHEKLCAPVKQALQDGNRNFEEIKGTMNMILNTLLNERRN
jgi:hypothetical protein